MDLSRRINGTITKATTAAATMSIQKLEDQVTILRTTLADELSSVSDLRLVAMDLDQDIFETSRLLEYEHRAGDAPPCDSNNNNTLSSLAAMTEAYFYFQEELIEMDCETRVMREQTLLLKSRSTKMQEYLRNKVPADKKKEALERGRSFKTVDDISNKTLRSAPGRMIIAVGPAAA
jgi:hypothetical protein